MEQVNKSVCIGMGPVGRKRMKMYLEAIKARGYSSFSAYVVDLLDKELGIELPRPSRREPVAQEV